MTDAVDDLNKIKSLEEVERFKKGIGAKYFAYLSSDGKKITTWMGDELGIVNSRKIARVGFRDISGRRPERYFLKVQGIDGRKWIVTGPGPGMYCRMRLAAESQ